MLENFDEIYPLLEKSADRIALERIRSWTETQLRDVQDVLQGLSSEEN